MGSEVHGCNASLVDVAADMMNLNCASLVDVCLSLLT